ncbi:hypothetical protein [Streptomyces sp. NPDC059176]|uniref:Rv1733c family protein n=1 Tax=Streptomyces sp. NPDC059176 TaxID=3346758 RepID=UPI0036B5C9E0
MAQELSGRRPPGASRDGLWHHVLRAAGREPRALSRPFDRARSRLVVEFALSVLVALSLAVAAAWTTWNGEGRRALVERQQRHPVTAVTVSTAETRAGATRSGVAQEAVARATWHFRGTAHRDALSVPMGTEAGSVVPIWVDADGRRVPRPRGTADVAAASGVAGLSVLIGLSAASLGVFSIRGRRLERRTLEAWDAEWATVEPYWSGRRGR